MKRGQYSAFACGATFMSACYNLPDHPIQAAIMLILAALNAFLWHDLAKEAAKEQP